MSHATDHRIAARLAELDDGVTRSVDATVRVRPSPAQAAETPERTGGDVAAAPRRPVTLTLAELPRVEITEPGEAPASPGAVPDFDVLGRLGAGGMGVVQLARQRGLRREVALKRLHPRPTRDDDDSDGDVALSSLLREAMLAGALEHPHIVPVHLLGVDADGRPVLVMKRIDGVPWRKLIYHPDHPRWQSVRDDRLTFHLEVLAQVCRAVEFAHSHGVLHRDIKPDNVMIGEFGEVYLLDWGTGCRLDTPEAVTEQLVGTPAYMAPEMVESGRTLDQRTDVFLLGATLHEALTGELRNAGAGFAAVLYAALASEPCDYGDDIPDELGALCNRACAADPAARHADAGALREALEDYLRHRGSLALAERAHEQLVAVEALIERDADDDLALYEAVGECRFAFEQALREWPDNEAARHGLRRLLTGVVELELARENLGAARTMLARLEPLPEALAARVAALETRLAEREREQQRLRALADDLDPEVSRTARSRMFALAVGFILLGVPLFVLGQQTGLLEFTNMTLLVPPLVLSALGLSIGVVWRRVFLRNRINRHIVGLVVTLLLLVCGNRLLGVVDGHAIEQTLFTDLVLLAGISSAAGVTVHRMMFGPALIALATAAASASVLTLTPGVFLVTFVACVLWVGVGRRVLARRRP